MPHNLPRLVRSETVYRGKVVSIQRDDLLLENGDEMHRETIVHPDCVCGVASLPDGRILLVKQYRHPTRSFLWEIPAGKIDPGETPEQAFRRELVEECGVGCTRPREVLSFYPSPGVLTERMHVFIATDCVEGAGEENPGEIAEWKAVTLEEARTMIERGEIADAKSIIGITCASGLCSQTAG